MNTVKKNNANTKICSKNVQNNFPIAQQMKHITRNTSPDKFSQTGMTENNILSQTM